MKHRSRIIIHLTAAILAFVVAACSTTRRLEEGETLYTGVKDIKYSLPEGEVLSSNLRSRISDATDAPTNKKMLFVAPVGLWFYNNADTTKRFTRWLYRKFASEPILVSDARPELRVKMIDQILANEGYFSGTASYDIVNQKNPRKAKIAYNIHPGRPYMINSVELLPDSTDLCHMIDSLARRQPYLTAGVQYNVDSLSVARTRITNSLRNRGYYFFKPEFIEYLADSVSHPGEVALRMTLADDIHPFFLQKYVTGKITVHTYRNQGGGEPDTIQLSRCTLVRMDPSRLRNSTIDNNVTFRPGKLFSVRDMNRTQTYLARLGIFNSIDINVMPDTTASRPTLDVNISCTFDTPLEASIEANVSSKSNSYLGPGLTLGLTNRNLFGGGELLSIKLTGSYEWQTGSGRSSIFNSYEAGLNASLSFPRFLAPKFIPHRKHAANWTRVSLNADLLNRPHYFKMAQFNLGYSYDWTANRYATNSLTLFKLTYTKLIHTTEAFDSITAENPAIALSFRSQYVPQLSYTYSYDRQLDRNNSMSFYVTLQEAGNLFWSIYELAGKHGEKKLFGTPFSQFVKGSGQFVYGRRITGNQWLWGRVAIGAAHAYGNASQVPYAEQFYCGGANSVRAFTVRSIGPGSYRPPKSDINGYFDQTGTFKFEANLEYRFPIFGPVHGAAFLDAGNVWLLKADPQRPGGTLKASTFLRDIALGTGVGLRLDITMIVVRADLGIGIHAPYDTGLSGYFNMRNFKNAFALHLAIGYPF